ncbi:MAG: carboxypeptidase PM20D1 [Halioglobus sp.]
MVALFIWSFIVSRNLFVLLIALLIGNVASYAGSSGNYVTQGSAVRLAEAVRIKTISHQDRSQINYDEFRRFHLFLRSSFPRVFSQLEIEAVNEHSLLFHWRGQNADLKPVLLTAHMDVVPVEPGTEQDWEHPAFDGVIADEKIYGRGTLDDKQGLMGILEAAESLLAEGFVPDRSLVFAFGHDEEISGGQGAVKLAQRMRELNWHFEWMVDEGGMVLADTPLLPGKTMALINVAEKGYLTLTLVATGEGGHSSRPPKISTIGRLSRALNIIEENPFEPRLVGPVEAMFEAMAPHVEQPQRFIFNNLWLTEFLVTGQMSEDATTNSFVRTTTALTMINAGIKENVIPQRAEAKVNFRLLPGDTPELVRAHIEALVNDPEIEFLVDNWNNIPGISDHEAIGFKVLAEAAASVYSDIVVVPSLLTATTDTRHYIDLADNQYRFHGVSMSDTQATSIHGTNEYVSVLSYENSIAIARQIIQLGAR